MCAGLPSPRLGVTGLAALRRREADASKYAHRKIVPMRPRRHRVARTAPSIQALVDREVDLRDREVDLPAARLRPSEKDWTAEQYRPQRRGLECLSGDPEREYQAEDQTFAEARGYDWRISHQSFHA
jgi:hypothetical protein